MSDLVGNHVVGFPTRWLKYCIAYLFNILFILPSCPDHRKNVGHHDYYLCDIQCWVLEKVGIREDEVPVYGVWRHDPTPGKCCEVSG